MRRSAMAKVKVALSVLAVLLMAAAAFPQGYTGKGRFSGLVTDTDGKPLEGVKVKLFCVRGQSGLETVTNKEGVWRVNSARGGPWNVGFEKPGYMPKTTHVEINEFDMNRPIEIQLERVAGLVVADELKAELSKGNALFEEGQYEEAIAAYEKIITAHPEMSIISINIGNCYFQMQKYDLAEEAYQKVLGKDPQNAEAMLLIGNCYTNRGENEKAMEWYNKIDYEKIADPMVLFNIGSSFYKQGQLDEALKYYKRAVTLREDFLDGIYQLGLVNVALNKPAEAIAAFERYLKYDADSERATQVKGFLEVLKKKIGNPRSF
jgi:Tfp pilus assembly protein PilF